MKPKNFSLILAVFAQLLFAQIERAPLQMTENSGFHQIVLSPEIRSASLNNLDFIRIFDSKNTEVPYVVLNTQTSTKSSKNFEILSKNSIPNVSTSIVVLNKDLEKLDELNLKIANTDVVKTYNISGSNDQKEWFGLVDNQTISNLSDENSTFVLRRFSFPLNQYKYLKFTFIDKKSLPVNILEASSETSFQNNSAPIILRNSSQSISTNTERKQSIIKLKFRKPQVIDEIRFNISAPNFYLRNAEISIPKTIVFKGKTQTLIESVGLIQISSKSENTFKISEIFTDELTITIDNQDNLPLEIENVNLYQNPISILVDLKKHEKYAIIINPKLSKPQYDLANVGLNFNQNFPIAKVNSLEKIEKITTKNAEKSFWQTALFMWICILVAILVIGFFAISMVKDLNKK
ncbi:DUF3999 family protein [Halpernia humi]|nr:DUF3999 family protein [Halpernia humi]